MGVKHAGNEGTVVLANENVVSSSSSKVSSTMRDGRPEYISGSDHGGQYQGTDTGAAAAARALLKEALRRAGTRHGLHLGEVIEIPKGSKRRKIHDDITVFVIKIEPDNQT